MEASKVLNAVFEYLEENMVPGMNDLQEIAFYTIKETVSEEAEKLLESVTKNPLTRAVVSIDKDGNVDTERLFNRLHRVIERKGVVEMEVPLYGNLKFTPEDIDKIAVKLNGGGVHEGYQITGRAY